MPANITANEAMIRDIRAIGQQVPDEPVRGEGRRIAGVQAQLWSETLRTDAGVEYMLFPRLLALAERGWSAAPGTPPYRPIGSAARRARRWQSVSVWGGAVP